MISSKKEYANKFMNMNLHIAKMILLFVSISRLDFIKNVDNSNKFIIVTNQFLYFTNISLMFTTFGVLLGIILRFNNKNQFLKNLYEFMVITSTVFAMVVGIIFWVLYSINPNLVTEHSYGVNFADGFKNFIKEFPKHFYPLIVIFLELRNIVLEHKSIYRFFLFAFSIFYISLCEYSIRIHNYYIYPFLAIGKIKGRVFSYLTITILCLSCYEILLFVHSFLNRKNKKK